MRRYRSRPPATQFRDIRDQTSGRIFAQLRRMFSTIRLRIICSFLLATWLFGAPRPVAAETLCDAALQDCRAILMKLIEREAIRIDVSFWFMEDARYSAALIRKLQAGVPVRVVMDARANTAHPNNATILGQLKQGGIPMRQKTGGKIQHRKFMLFAGQNQVEFSGANYSPDAFVPTTPYINYVDEAIYFSDDPSVVNSFKTMFDNVWTSTSGYADYANVANRVRAYPTYPIDPELNFPPGEDYALRAVKRYKAETARIDVQMYRITDRRHADAMIAASQRGISVRIYTDDFEYRDAAQLWHAWNVDRIWAAGIPIKVPAHSGINHEKAVLLYGQGLTVFGSSNWTLPSANSQAEHNYFTNKQWVFNWFASQFERKWNNSNPTGVPETRPFTPLPPDAPAYQWPPNGTGGIAANEVKLRWYGGPWAHYYDIYFGTDPFNLPLLVSNLALGPSLTPGQTQSFMLPMVTPGTTYYWRVVSKTAAAVAASGPTWSFLVNAIAAQPGAPSHPFRLWWQDQRSGLISTSAFNGTTLAAGAPVVQLNDPNWKLVGSGDINGDGQQDLFWHNIADGRLFAWLMTGGTILQAVFISPPAVNDLAWNIRALADFNSDGRPDLVWQNKNDGRVVIWLMNGTDLIRGLVIGQVLDTRWRIMGAGDMNGDGHTDLIWQNKGDGRVFAWAMNYTTVVEGLTLVPGQVIDPSWTIRVCTDIDGDGQTDLLWQHDKDGRLFAWLMTRNVLKAGALLTPSQVSDTKWILAAGK
jgi:phosphatidylserine/phosphatidylglycerophosphate/cardiolipin synthase-like enzyme